MKALETKKKEEEADEQRKLARLQGPSSAPDHEKTTSNEQAEVKIKVEVEDIEDDDTVKFQRLSYAQTSNQSRIKSDLDDEDCTPFNLSGTNFVNPDFADDDEDDEDKTGHTQAKTEAEEETLAVPVSIGAAFDVKQEDVNEESQWHSVQQLVAFRQASVAIGDEFIKREGTTLQSNKRQAAFSLRDDIAASMYRSGKEDARKIDVRGKRIEDRVES